MDDTWARVFGAFMAAMGIWMIRLGRQSKATAEEAKHWPTTEAVITTSKVKKMPGANAKFRLKVAGNRVASDRIESFAATESERLSTSVPSRR